MLTDDRIYSADKFYSMEAEVFTAYLISSSLREREKKLYNKAMAHLDLKLSNFDKEILKRMMKSKTNMATIDAGLALIKPTSLVRRKLFTMLAILEASPNYTSYFIPQEYNFSYYFKLAFTSFRAVFRAVVGFFLVKKIERKCI